jgi:hypothetical protein
MPLQNRHCQHYAITYNTACANERAVYGIMCRTAYSEEMIIQMNDTIFWEVRAQCLLGIHNKPLLKVSFGGQWIWKIK